MNELRKWISITERLPQEATQIIYLDKMAFVHVAWLYQTGMAHFQEVATHWMEVPPSPNTAFKCSDCGVLYDVGGAHYSECKLHPGEPVCVEMDRLRIRKDAEDFARRLPHTRRPALAMIADLEAELGRAIQSSKLQLVQINYRETLITDLKDRLDYLRTIANSYGVRSEQMAACVHEVLAPMFMKTTAQQRFSEPK